jgi:plastocyanin
MRFLQAAAAVVALAALAGCGGYAANGPYGGGGGMGTGSGGGGGGPVGSVSVGNGGNIVFTSGHNGSAHPAVDTVAAGATVTWTWVGTGGLPHSVRSTGSQSFVSSPVLTGDGKSYAVMFMTSGVYQYDCAVHGQQMTGTVVVR